MTMWATLPTMDSHRGRLPRRTLSSLAAAAALPASLMICWMIDPSCMYIDLAGSKQCQ